MKFVERASRISIKTRKTKKRIEEEIFGVLGDENMFRLSGHNSEIRGGIFTSKAFVDKFGDNIPKGHSTLTFSKSGNIGPIETSEEVEVKIIGISIYWMIRNKRFVKHIPFAWLFGNSEHLKNIKPIFQAENAFYSFLFGRLYDFLTKGYETPLTPDIRRKVAQTHLNLIKKVEEEFKKELTATEVDEQVFQNLLNKYKFFIHLGAKLIESQPVLKGKIVRKPDFCIILSETEKIYVEIEPAFSKAFQGSALSKRLEDALEQVSDWKKILLSNDSEQDKIRYIIIIGLLSDHTNEEKKHLEQFNKNQKDLVVLTYDYILKNIEKMKDEVQTKLSSI